MHSNYKLILGSASPRRKQLLEGTDMPFTVEPVHGLDEDHFPGDLDPCEIPLWLAKSKSLAFPWTLRPDELLITADTLVFTGQQSAAPAGAQGHFIPIQKHGRWSVLGKPHSTKDARRMLQDLSGRCHKVITGVYLRSGEDPAISAGFDDQTLVWFTPLSDWEIDYYIKRYEPYDKAGSYGVQEWIGYIGIDRIEGSYFNVMGFPVHKIWSLLKQLNVVSFP
ncbi:MAG TPA: Maf family protein [Bacteroidales bacterium]|nr:Maf family protein [Bacteroidales bacterium]